MFSENEFKQLDSTDQFEGKEAALLSYRKTTNFLWQHLFLAATESDIVKGIVENGLFLGGSSK